MVSGKAGTTLGGSTRGGDASTTTAVGVGAAATRAALGLRRFVTGLQAGELVLGQAAHDDRDVRAALEDLASAAAGTWLEALLRAGLVGVAGRHEQLFAVQLVVVLGVGDGRVEQLADQRGGVALAELEHLACALHVEAADEVEHDADLARRTRRVAQDGTGAFALIRLGTESH